MTINTRKYIEEFLKIRTKTSEIASFRLNAPQAKLYDAIKARAEAGKPQRVIVLKARQMGFSTLTEAIIFKKTATAYNVSSAVVAHDEETATKVFNMSKLFYDNLPEQLKPQMLASNAKELVFDSKKRVGFGSSIRCLTSGNAKAGRGSTFQNLHVSEYAFWQGDKKATLNGLLQAVPNTPNSLVVIESTANGYEHFKELWDASVAGENDFVAVFCAWWEMPEYRLDEAIELTEAEREIKERFNLDDGQMAWRRWCIKNNCGGDVNLFKQEYPASPDEAFLASGECLFDKELIIVEIERNRPLIGKQKRGEFEYKKTVTPIKNAKGEIVDVDEEISDIAFVERENGLILMHELPNVKTNGDGEVVAREPYAIGGDTAGLGMDYYTAKVVSCVNGRTVATLRKQRIDEDKYADQIYCLGKFYHDALVGIETNYSRVPTRTLEKLRYPNMYVRERLDTSTREVTKIAGFETTGTTKPIIVSNLIALMRESPMCECDVDTLKEMLVFVRKENGRQEAQQGYHDDLVMAKAIANFIAAQQGDPNWIKVAPSNKPMSKIEKFFAEQYEADEDEKRSIVEW